MSTRSLHEYSLWLEPKGEKYDQLKNIIVDLSIATRSPLFDPHLTLLGGITMPVEKIIEKIKILAERSRAITLSLIATHSGDFYYKSIFLECEKTESLMNLNKEAQKIFSQPFEYNPHLSLLYSDVSQTKKDMLIEKINRKLILPLNFVVDTISLWEAFGPADKWQKIYNVFL